MSYGKNILKTKMSHRVKQNGATNYNVIKINNNAPVSIDGRIHIWEPIRRMLCRHCIDIDRSVSDPRLSTCF